MSTQIHLTSCEIDWEKYDHCGAYSKNDMPRRDLLTFLKINKQHVDPCQGPSKYHGPLYSMCLCILIQSVNVSVALPCWNISVVPIYIKEYS